MRKQIYLDSAATSLHRPKSVAEAVCCAMGHLGNSGRGANEASLDASRTIYGTREKLARLFQYPHPEQVVFTKNATEALNIAICGLFAPGDHVITTMLEHNSVLRPLYRLQDAGLELTIVPCDDSGYPDYEAMARAVKEHTKGIVCTHASNLTGNLVDISRVGQIAREHELLFVLDASQTAGVFPVHMEEDNIDIVCFSGHKALMGPQGTGGLCVRKEVTLQPFYVGGSGIRTFEREHPKDMPVRLEAGTLNVHGIAGLEAGLDYLEETGTAVIREREQKLARQFYEGVRILPTVKVYGDFAASRRAPVVALNLGETDSAQVGDELMEQYGICTRTGGHCAPLMHQMYGTKEQGMVRFSFSSFNTEEEVDAAVSALRHMDKQVISVAGAGGKTTYIQEQAESFLKRGLRVLITTTTHMLLPREGCDGDISQIRTHLDERGWAVAGRPVRHKGAWKMEGPEEEVLKQAIEMADVTLIEADGSRNLPFKVPKPWEPVIPPETTQIVLIAGMAATKGPIKETCYNQEDICRLLQAEPEHSLMEEEMIWLLKETYLERFKKENLNLPVQVYFTDWSVKQHYREIKFYEGQEGGSVYG